MTTPAPIVITGPTGWIGTAMLAYLSRQPGGWAERVSLFGSSARQITAADGTALAMRALETLKPADLDGAIVVHLAYLTKEKVDLLGERRFSDTNLEIDDQLLTALAGAKPKSVFVASSGAAMLAATGRDRHPYGMSKLRQEDRFRAWAVKTATPLIVGRIFNLAGPYINKIDSYAIGSFVGQAKRSGSIQIDAQVPVFRSYLHVDDLCALIVRAGQAGVGRPVPIDFCGAETVEMSDTALAVAHQLGGGIAIGRRPVDWSKPSAYLGDFTDTKVLAMELDLPLAPFSAQVADTVHWIEVSGL
ncbi:MAG: NAD(P)-dependent oxidoreductase [Sphingomonas sp.]|uniref:NAD-dependent epimerase/dehydratase family protein n=1 Tax=Sphingomonas sp. TaxID=28214 RepID=UPI0035A94BEF|nr:NAD(P)-dependent oxidoreductase [Sphingomonas sp.]